MHLYLSPQPWNKQIPLVPSTVSTSAFTPFSGANIAAPSLGKYDYESGYFHFTAVIWIRLPRHYNLFCRSNEQNAKFNRNICPCG